MTDTATPTLIEPRRLLDPRARIVWTWDSIIWAVIVLGVLSTVNYLWWPQAEWAWWVIGGLGVLHAVDILVVPHWQYRVNRWEVSDEAVFTREGWLSLEHRIAPMSRVQTVDVDRGPIQRALGLATVTVTTASSAGPVEIGPVGLGTATALVERITAAAGTQDAT